MEFHRFHSKVLVLLALVLSAVVGLIVVAFVAVTEKLGHILVTADATHRFLSPLIGSLVAGWLLYRYFPDARGSGIPQTRVALALERGVIGLRAAIGKFVCSSVSLGSGVALGREGPSVHIGAAVASVAGRRLGLSEEQVRALIPVGTAAAIAAAFNTPLAAVLFTLEEILTDLRARMVGTVVIGAATSWIVLRLILGDEPLFHVPSYELVHPVEFLLYALLGLLGGTVSTGFVKFLLWQRARFLQVRGWGRALTPAVGGLTVGLLALMQPGVLGVGYNLVSDALNGRLDLKVMLILLVLKMFATSTCYGSGNAGGIFGPSLFIGAMLGGAMGQTAHALMPDHTGNAGAYALVGMGAAFAGIIRTPMTSVIMIFELTRDYTIIVPLMIANLCSYLLAKRWQRLPLYEALAAQEGIALPSPDHVPDPLTVAHAMEPAPVPPEEHGSAISVHPDDLLGTALQKMGAANADEILVTSRTAARPVAVLRMSDVLRAYRRFSEKEEIEASPAAQNVVPMLAAITIATVLIVSGLVFWQRSRQAERGMSEYASGQKLVEQRQFDAAVAAFRNALARNPRQVKWRAALGLALLESGHPAEASSYLEEVAKAQPRNGAVRAGQAKIAVALGRSSEALKLYRAALAADWPEEEASRRRQAQLEYAEALTEAGRKSEAVQVLLTSVQQNGSDSSVGKEAAERIESSGTPEQAESAWTALSLHFPGDAEVWRKLGDIRLRRNEDAQALDAYTKAAAAAPDDGIRQEVRDLEEILRVDPTRKSLSVRERAERWDSILHRIAEDDSGCAPAEQVERAQALLKQHVRDGEALQIKSEATREVWRQSAPACRTDRVLTHVMAKVGP